jgi:hypothetical protein
LGCRRVSLGRGLARSAPRLRLEQCSRIHGDAATSARAACARWEYARVDSSLRGRKSLQAGRSAPPLAKMGTRTMRPAVPGSRAPRKAFAGIRGTVEDEILKSWKGASAPSRR